MAEETRPADLAKRTVVYRIPGMDAVSVRRDVEFRASEGVPLTMDLYAPPDPTAGERRPVVVVVAGYPDPGFQKILGCSFKDMGASVSWGRLIAASGLAAIVYSNRDPREDLDALLLYLRETGPSIGIDGSRIGLFASSGNVPLALSTLMKDHPVRLKCAALCYGYMLDVAGSTAVADAARTFRFVHPAAGRSVQDLPQDVPLFVARAGRDATPRLNESLDRFLQAALACNLPVTLVNHPDAPHAFDLFHDSEATRVIIRSILAFLRSHLVGEASA